MTAPGPLSVPTPPDLPLARTVEMPEHVGYPSGALSLRFAELTVEAEEPPSAVPVSDGDRTIVALPPLVVRARYAIDARPDPVATVDAGGDLSVLPDQATAPRSADEPDAHPEWLENARNQHMELAQTSNGRSLLSTYDQHKDVYAELFDQSQSTFTDDIWTANGGTAQMAADTHEAVGTGEGVINDSAKTYPDPYSGDLNSYNVNAFVRQNAVAVYTLALDPEDNPTQGKYYDAVQAVYGFAIAVNDTRNDKTSTTPMTRDDVYQAVADHSGEVSAEAVRSRMAALLNPFSDDVWEGWDDDERDLIREFHRRARAGREALRAAAVPTALFEGAGSGRVAGASAVTDASGAVRVELPHFEVVLDDTAWTGAAAGVARDRLNAAGFLADLVRDAVAERLRAAVAEGDPTLLADPGR
ncbi:hypothetical protein [Saccharothrix xinjiangensis]|uniref:Uncharacterized protein n=1 Tax=Saccharothrix xinjiangensis TaxID=204798 RepID=A0ABV9XYG7_9PSEU